MRLLNTFKPLRDSFALILLLILATPVFAEEERWDQLKDAYFKDKVIVESDDVIRLDAPQRAFDAAVVPIRISTLDPDRVVKKVHLFVDMNPLPLAGIFEFTEAAGAWKSMETDIRINEYTHIRAIGELEDGSLHMVKRFVKAAGGCSAPAMADLQAALAKAGKMQLLIDDISSATAGQSQASIKISHPNNSGMQFDQVSRNYIPAFYVNKIGADFNGKQLMNIETNFSLSENPSFKLAFNTGDDTKALSVYAVDSSGNRYEKSIVAR